MWCAGVVWCGVVGVVWCGVLCTGSGVCSVLSLCGLLVLCV